MSKQPKHYTGQELINKALKACDRALFMMDMAVQHCDKFKDPSIGDIVRGSLLILSYYEISTSKTAIEVLDDHQEENTKETNLNIEPLALEVDLLLKRIAQGGFSGEFLADAFISTYRLTPFKHSLGALTKLDAEGFRLFNQVLHIRHIKGWSDDALYQIQLKINWLVGATKGDGDHE